MARLKTYIYVGLAGAAGACTRYGLGLLIAGLFPSPMPWATLVINLTGAFALGLLAGLPRIAPHIRATVGAGFLGAYTTFSTWAVDTVRLAENGQTGYAAANVLLSLALGLPLAWLGLSLARRTRVRYHEH